MSITVLQEENRKQQRKINELEMRLSEADARLVQLDHRVPVTGGSCSMHLTQASAHFNQAISVACSYVASGCNICRRSRGAPEEPEPASPDRPLKRKKSLTPTWMSAMDKHVVKQARIQVGGNSKLSIVDVQSAQKGAGGSAALEDHEYILEDEWESARTAVINPKAQWKGVKGAVSVATTGDGRGLIRGRHEDTKRQALC